MIKRKEIKPQEVVVYAPDHTNLGYFNEYEFADLKLQICTEEAEGYYVAFEGKYYPIDSDGLIVNHPEVLFDFLHSTVSNIINVRRRR